MINGYTVCDNYIKCPHCGYEHDDANNRTDGIMEGEMTCYGCERDFTFEVEWTPTWWTKKIEKYEKICNEIYL